MIVAAGVFDRRLPLHGLVSRLWRRLRPPSETIEGYQHPDLVDVVFKKALAYAVIGEWPEMLGVTSVLDFGGGFGDHYKLARLQSPSIKWAVVETPAMVAKAAELATGRLRFFSSIPEAAAWLGSIEVMHSSGALQYTPEPEVTLRELCGLRAKRMLWQRMALSTDRLEREMQSSNLGDNGPGRLAGLKEKIVL
jgi:putative methyltransferase (TIGR04325 family)